ncbi:hypothetical protein [Peribacillus butanolivorans]
MLYSPKWSKAKKRLSDFLCETLRLRVDFQVINCRKAHDQLGRAVITVDEHELIQYFYKLRCDAENIKMNQFISSGSGKKIAIKHCFIQAHKKIGPLTSWNFSKLARVLIFCAFCFIYCSRFLFLPKIKIGSSSSSSYRKDKAVIGTWPLAKKLIAI